MATKSSKKSSQSKKPVSKAPVKTTTYKRKSVRQCMDESEVLRFHMKIITILSIVVAILVGALVLSIVASFAN